jgi:hypothetical protein
MNNQWPGFGPADILLPQNCDLTKWSVVACDQYTSQNDYWERVAQTVGDAPSTLKLILPESQLEDGHFEEHVADINRTMDAYLDQGLFRPLPNALIYVERWLDNKKLRRGLVGVVDLECYDYNAGSSSLIRATEGTVITRLPPRVAVRRNASLELPHIMVLVDDPDKQLIEHLTYETDRMEEVYDFDLMERGGHITGYLLPEDLQADVCEILNTLARPHDFARKYDAKGKPVLLFAIGDGNHSLAAAKAAYEEKKQNTPQEQWADLPSRYALVELVNLHDESLEFEPIHRVCFDVDADELMKDFLAAYPGAHYGDGDGHTITYVFDTEVGKITVPKPTAQLPVGTLQEFLDQWMQTHSGRIDYVHGDDVTWELGRKPGNIGFLLPAMGKDELFKTVIFDGALPRKTFSMGEAHDKRFYLEARKIK